MTTTPRPRRLVELVDGSGRFVDLPTRRPMLYRARRALQRAHGITPRPLL